MTVMLTNIIERTKRDGLLHDLQIEGEGGAAVRRALTSLEDTIAVALNPVEKRKIIEAIARANPGHDPRTRPQRPTVDDGDSPSASRPLMSSCWCRSSCRSH